MQFGWALGKVLYDSMIKICFSCRYSFKNNKEIIEFVKCSYTQKNKLFPSAFIIIMEISIIGYESTIERNKLTVVHPCPNRYLLPNPM
jgi:hypothetical protein